MASSSVDNDRWAILPACQLIWNTTLSLMAVGNSNTDMDEDV
jgi:hypothetical protein